MTAPKKPTPFSIIRHRGQPNRAQLPDGTWVYAMDKIFVEEWSGFVPVAPYSDHFIYVAPKDSLGSTWRCSCGSIAVATGPNGYVLDASPQGKMIVCKYHADNGVHMTGGARWV